MENTLSIAVALLLILFVIVKFIGHLGGSL